MKTKMKTVWGMTVVFAAVLVFAFAGCDGSGGNNSGSKPTSIKVTSGETEIGELTLGVNEPKSLTVSAKGATSYYWDVENGTGKVTLSTEDGAETTVTGATAGTATIFAYAKNSKGTVSKEITVTILPPLPSITLSVKRGSVEVNAPIAMVVDEEVELTITTDPSDANVVWTGNNTATATFNNTTKKITAVAEGSTSFTVTASKTGHSDAVKTITVNVSEVQGNPISLTIKEDDADGDDVTDISIPDETTIQLFADVDPDDAEVTWASSDGSIVTVVDGLVKAEKTGTATITVSAVKEGHQTAQVIIPVTVNTNPDLIFKWDYVRDNGINLGTAAFGTGNTGMTLAGKGKLTSIPIRITGGNATVMNINYDQGGKKGIWFDGKEGGTGVMVLVIGSQYSGSGTGELVSASTASSSPEGVFKFNDWIGETSKKVQVSIGCEFLSDATVVDTGGRSFAVYLNNNTTGGTASPLANSNSHRLAYWMTPQTNMEWKEGSTYPAGQTGSNYGTTGGNDKGRYILADKTYYCVPFSKTASHGNFATANNALDTLNKAFLGLALMGPSGSNVGANVLITSIKIELVD